MPPWGSLARSEARLEHGKSTRRAQNNGEIPTRRRSDKGSPAGANGAMVGMDGFQICHERGRIEHRAEEPKVGDVLGKTHPSDDKRDSKGGKLLGGGGKAWGHAK